MPNPEVYTEGLGELIRAKRLYTGLSKDGFAKQLGMADRSYERIEDGTAPTPPGLLDSVERVLDRFDHEVVAVVGTLPSDESVITMNVDDRPRNEWNRAVVARAAVESSRITPILVGDFRGGPREASDRLRRRAGEAAAAG